MFSSTATNNNNDKNYNNRSDGNDDDDNHSNYTHTPNNHNNRVRSGPGWNSELLVTNTRFFGHALSAIRLEGGHHALITNNIIGDNSNLEVGLHSGIEVRANHNEYHSPCLLKLTSVPKIY